MRILAIDPGYTESAWVLYDTETRLPVSWLKESNERVRDRYLGRYFWAGELPRTTQEGRDDVRIVIEMVASYGMPVGKEVFETCVWIGRFIERAPNVAELVYRREVKLHLCGSVRANDSTIRQALIDRYGPTRQIAIGRKASPGPLYGFKADCWQALALAITHAETGRAPEALAA